MTDTMLPDRERLDTLLANRSLFGLSRQEAVELDSLVARFPDADTDCFDRIAATIDLALGTGRFEPMPESLQAAIRQQATRHLSGMEWSDNADRPPTQVHPVAAVRGHRYREWIAWTLAAAGLAAALLAWFYPAGPIGKSPSVAKLRSEMIVTAKDLVCVDWQTTGDPAARQATGDVAWDSAEQRGYMRFRGLQANDPDQYQYQLWIFDADRDDRYPIDGGVFDVRAGREEVIVPIQAKLRVRRPAMFAVTVEEPGGVVVSSRERICLVAKLDR